MAFNTLEYLEQGKVEFVGRLSFYDRESLIKHVRNSNNKINIINGFLPKLKKVNPWFCFEIIYDMDQYVEDVFDLISGRLGCKVGYINLINNEEKIKNILNNTTWGRTFVFRNLTNIIRANKKNINVILDYVFTYFEENLDIIKKLSIYKDLHIRYIFMEYLVKKYPEKIKLIYDDITRYLIGYTYEENEQLTFLPDLMSKEDISNLAFSALNSNLNKELWYKLKEYILANYKDNNLASLLLGTYREKQRNEIEFIKDSDRLFSTSSNFKLTIYHNYSKYISKELLDRFRSNLKYFEKDRKDDYDIALSMIFNHGLWNELEGYVDKYLSLSKDADFRYLSNGSTSSCYKIGDYVFKLNKFKWSYEDVICPNLYLILKNLEEHYIRDEKGIVTVGIEVQKYLSRRDIKITPEHLRRFEQEMRRLGYYVNDRLINGTCGDNCMLLDSYMDADHPNPEILPNEFKEVPLVLIDRDRVYKIGNRMPKLLRQSWS